MSEPITGGCQCGAVRYALTEMLRTDFCHCGMCRKATGGVFSALTAAPRTSFAWTRGQPSYASSTAAERGFCSACGTPLSFAYHASRKISVTVGSLDDLELAGPNQSHFAAECRLSWAPICDGAPEERLDAYRDSPVHQPGYQSFQAPPGDET